MGDDFTYGIMTSLRPGTTAQLSGNVLGGSGGRFDRGIALWNVGTSPTSTTVSNSTVGHSDKGISLTYEDANFGPADSSAEADFSGVTATGNQVGAVVDGTNSGANTVTMMMTNSTLSGNSATNGGGLTSVGTGGIARTTITNSTLTDNSPSGPGILLQDASLTVGNSIFHNVASGTNISALGSSVSSLGYNLSSDIFGGFISATGDQVNTDPILGPLQDNGGPTFTHAPLSNSPAIDKGKDISGTGQDQRGSLRFVTYDPAIVPPVGGDRSDIGAVELHPGVQPVSAVSRKIHGAAGPFDITLPLSGVPGIESRSGGATNAYQIILTFATTVTYSSATVTNGTGTVSSSSGSGTTTITVNLTGVTSQQTITLALFNVDDGTNSGDTGVRMSVLVGDVTANGMVDGADVALTKSQAGETVDGSNFREDVTANGTIGAADIALVKTKSGNVLPPP